MGATPAAWVGRSVERVEDAALLTGRGRYLDDIAVRPDTLHAAILRSPHAHARILSIRSDSAKNARGVAAVLVGADVTALSASLLVGIRAKIECWPIAVDRVRYVGEPVAVIVAENRYLAEDALDLIEVDYEPLPVVVDPLAALESEGPPLHDVLGSNLATDRFFSYGDPDQAFAEAAHRIAVTVRYPRNSCTPIETYGVVAEYDPGTDAYDILANFQGPFSLHSVMARALKVPGNRLRLRTPADSGGSFGVKQAVFPYVVLMGVVARATGRPVKWIEDRLEHLTASVSATNRVTHLDAAVAADGRVLALAWDQIDDVGAHIRAPEPATLYRMHGNLTGAYDIRHVSVRNRVVLTNKTPTGLNRGFGGPQMYYALERLMQRIAVALDLDPVEVIRRNLVPADAFPYRTATGAQLDSGDYGQALETALRDGRMAELRQKREEARKNGRIYGIGYAAAVEPSVSNMGYITTIMPVEERRRAGPKNGAQATATVALDPLGSVSVHIASVPQGQGHRTVAAQVVADVLGLRPSDVRVITDLDTTRDAWSIASGNYSSRFAPAVAGAVQLAAIRLAEKLKRIAAAQLNVAFDDVTFANGRVLARSNPDNALPFARVASTSHWSPGTVNDVDQALRETVFWTPPQLTAPTDADEINSSLCHGFIFDFCGVEIDRVTGAVRIDKYVTMHDCGRVLHPGMVAGQVTGAFAHAVGAALYEEYAYGPDGSFLAGTFADYLVPTSMEIPAAVILHLESPSPFTPLGAKGVGEGNCMSTPVCLANAVADALAIAEIDLPLTPAKIAAHLHPAEAPPAVASVSLAAGTRHGEGGALQGEGEATVPAKPAEVWRLLLDPDTLASIIPGSHGVEKFSDTRFQAAVTLGVGPVKGRYRAVVALSDLDPTKAVTLAGTVAGALGVGRGRGRITLAEDPAGTRISYTYEAEIGGKVAAVGGRLLDGAARVIIAQFFAALARKLGGGESVTPVWHVRLRAWFVDWRDLLAEWLRRRR
jgi:2-furoyl-CoA dehydrogenase large subunit